MPNIIFDSLYPQVSAPVRSTAGSAGYDLAAHLTGRSVRVWHDNTMEQREAQMNEGVGTLVLSPGEKALVPLGFRARLPAGFEAQIRPRSGMSVKTDLVIANAPGTVDPDYPDEWCVPVKNGGTRELRIAHGDRIAQLVLARFEVAEFTAGSVVPTTDRAGGFGSTGAGVRRAALLCLLGLAAPAAVAQQPGKVSVESFTLPNGLAVHLVEDHSSQVVAVDIWYDVGARNERPSRTGFAHLFEHMMFQGSEHVKKAEHFQYVERAGGQLNGSTQADRTNYWDLLPSNRLNLGLWLEADRMRSLAVTQANLDNQKEAVKEERRLRFDNQPYVGVFVDSLSLIYDQVNCFAYGHSLIGSMNDLNAAKVEDVQAFFKQYYAPNNASLVLVGDFQTSAARALVQRYFGDIPRVGAPPPVQCNQAFNSGTVRRRVTDKNATLPAILQFYRIPAVSDADYPALDLLSTILGQGESSRLNRVLARETKAAAGVQAAINPVGPVRGPGLFGTFIVANQGVATDSILKLLDAQIAKVVSEGVSAGELSKAKNSYRANTITGRQRALGVAEAVQFAAMFLGGPDKINTDIGRYDAVTLADIKRVATTYLRGDNMLSLVIVPEGK
jgi:zinc protease